LKVGLKEEVYGHRGRVAILFRGRLADRDFAIGPRLSRRIIISSTLTLTLSRWEREFEGIVVNERSMHFTPQSGVFV
jgi:hypothetical protein